MTDNEEKPSLEARVQELERQVAERQNQLATLTGMIDRIVKPANKFVGGIALGISALKEHLKKSDKQ